jgi:hypothetical protein
VRTALLVLASVFFGGCGAPGTFNCQDDTQCSNDGICEADGFCSFPDADCPSMRRYGEHAPAGLAGQCVLPSGTGTGPDPSTTSGPDPSTTNPAVDTTESAAKLPTSKHAAGRGGQN